jgi:hypothetical protein
MKIVPMSENRDFFVRQQRALALAASLAVGMIILAFALAGVSPVPHWTPHQDKIEHMAAFAALGFTLSWAASRVGLFLGVIALLAFAVEIEYLQATLTTTRVASKWDVVASVLGGMGGTMLGWRAWRLARLWRGSVQTRP